jgi:hypothetical protein
MQNAIRTPVFLGFLSDDQSVFTIINSQFTYSNLSIVVKGKVGNDKVGPI